MEFLNRTVKLGGNEYGYQVSKPGQWAPDRKWPVALFLHGAAERGSDNISQTKLGLARAAVHELPMIVVLPQCPLGRWWPEPEMQQLALKALDESATEFSGDPRRFYLTGMSMGGYGTWAIAAMNPGRFAALAPVCGGVRPPALFPPSFGFLAGLDLYKLVAQRVGRTPVWVFHGDSDPIIPVSESRKMVEAIKAEGGNVRYSEYKGVGHNSWDRAYSEPEFFPWLLSQRLAG